MRLYKSYNGLTMKIFKESITKDRHSKLAAFFSDLHQTKIRPYPFKVNQKELVLYESKH